MQLIYIAFSSWLFELIIIYYCLIIINYLLYRCEKCGMKNFDLSPPIGSKISENENLPSSHYIKPIKNFQPINEFSAPMLQSDKMINPCYHYENGCDEENDDYSEDFRILESTGNCRCENEDCSPRSKISERLKSNYENARILHLEHLTCHRWVFFIGTGFKCEIVVFVS